jgi:hypothetical protein
MRIGIGIGLQFNKSAGLDPATSAFITATGITDPTQINAVNRLVLNYKGQGNLNSSVDFWTSTPAIYPMVGGTVTAHKFNLKDSRDLDAAFRLAFSGGWTHDSNGAKPNGTNAYAQTFLVPSTSLNVNNHSVSYYSGTNLSELSADPVNLGAFNSITQAITLAKPNATLNSRLNSTLNTIANLNMRGFNQSVKTSSSESKLYQNGVALSTGVGGGSLPTIEIYIGTLNLSGSPYVSGYVRNDFRFMQINNMAINDANALLMYQVIQQFQTDLGRNVA